MLLQTRVFDSTPAVCMCMTHSRFATVAAAAAVVLQGVPHHDEEAQQACRVAGGHGVATRRCVLDPVECMS